MFNALLENLTNIGWAMLVFLCAYLANVAFSLWYNIKIRKEDFDREKADRKRLENPCFRRWPDASVYGYYCTSDFCKRSRLDYS